VTRFITGGTVVTAEGTLDADVVIEGEKIAAVLARDSALARDAASFSGDYETIDATGLYVIPGGIDAHTHMEMPFGGTF
jgi:dihydropyrimidinase